MIRCIVWLVAITSLSLTHARAETLSRLDNGVIQIGVDLDHGGTITWLGRSHGGENLINSHDLGRQIQQSYYSGPAPYGKAHPNWKNWSWNPIGTGDVYGHPSRVLKHTNDGRSLEVKSIPMQWALDNVPGKCEFETLITLEGPTARVRCRLINHRADTTQYPAHDQELPAVYTIGKLHRLFTYEGGEPFTNRPLKLIKNAGPPWSSWKASENWAALVDDRDFGVGVIHPGIYSFIGGFHGKPGQGARKTTRLATSPPSAARFLITISSTNTSIFSHWGLLTRSARSRPRFVSRIRVPTIRSPTTGGTGRSTGRPTAGCRFTEAG